MTPRKRPRSEFAARLGILALAIQALIPVLLAAEIDIADREKGASVFALCAFGHVHFATLQDKHHGGNNAPVDDEQGAPCPICIALIASPAFTAPPQIVLPLPRGQAVAALIARDGESFFRRTTTAYRSRAPPVG